jgi:hypothetical protein
MMMMMMHPVFYASLLEKLNNIIELRWTQCNKHHNAIMDKKL